jgi:predicted DNA-binding transcriptional regulator AlpA
MMTAKHLLDRRAVAYLLGVSRAEVGRMVRQQVIPYIVLPNKEIRFDEAELRRWLKTRQHGPAQGVPA